MVNSLFIETKWEEEWPAHCEDMAQNSRKTHRLVQFGLKWELWRLLLPAETWRPATSCRLCWDGDCPARSSLLRALYAAVSSV